MRGEKGREMKGKNCLYFRGVQRKGSYYRRLKKGQKVMREFKGYFGRKVKMKCSEV